MKRYILFLGIVSTHQIHTAGWAKITISNKTKDNIIVLLKRIGGMGIHKREMFICAEKKIAAQAHKTITSHYPYKKNYKVIVYDADHQIRFKSIKKAQDKDSLNFPKDFSVTNQFVPLHNQLPYDKACFLTAHNAHTNKAQGWMYAQQKWSIRKQLNKGGVRGFMLDLHSGPGDQILLAHGGTTGCYNCQKCGRYQKFDTFLEIIQDWLEKNPHEVVTLFL